MSELPKHSLEISKVEDPNLVYQLSSLWGSLETSFLQSQFYRQAMDAKPADASKYETSCRFEVDGVQHSIDHIRSHADQPIYSWHITREGGNVVDELGEKQEVYVQLDSKHEKGDKGKVKLLYSDSHLALEEERGQVPTNADLIQRSTMFKQLLEEMFREYPYYERFYSPEQVIEVIGNDVTALQKRLQELREKDPEKYTFDTIQPLFSGTDDEVMTDLMIYCPDDLKVYYMRELKRSDGVEIFYLDEFLPPKNSRDPQQDYNNDLLITQRHISAQREIVNGKTVRALVLTVHDGDDYTPMYGLIPPGGVEPEWEGVTANRLQDVYGFEAMVEDFLEDTEVLINSNE